MKGLRKEGNWGGGRGEENGVGKRKREWGKLKLGTYYIVHRLIEAGVLTEDEEDNEQHVDMMETVNATVVQLLQQRNNL